MRDFNFFLCRVILCNDILAEGLGVIHTTVHINPSRKSSFYKTLLKSEEFENADSPEALLFRVEGNFLKSGVFWKLNFSDRVSNSSQTQIKRKIQNDWWLLRFQIVPTSVEWTTESQEILIHFQSVNTVSKCP